jgi:hypothetical protein
MARYSARARAARAVMVSEKSENDPRKRRSSQALKTRTPVMIRFMLILSWPVDLK